jgi:hypothetical protein
MQRSPILQPKGVVSPKADTPTNAVVVPGARPAARQAAPATTGPQRRDIISGVVDASVDVRKACNTIKRMASLGSAAMVSGLNAAEAVEVSRRMAFDVLNGIGFNTDDDQRVDAVMPMMMEATALVLADAARNAPGGTFGPKELSEAATLGVKALNEIAKSRVVAKMIEPAWPADIDTVTALRLASASAMAQIAVEVAQFDFAHTPADCIKEAGKVVVKAAMEASATMAPARSSAAARSTLTQSLINSAARLYAATWRAVAAERAAELDALSDEAVDVELGKMSKEPIATLLAPVNARFVSAFSVVTGAAIDMFASPAPAAAQAAGRPQAARFRNGR